jgi:aconitate hydratase
LKITVCIKPKKGIQAVLAESFDPTHKKNLICMGILPLKFINGQTPSSLKMTGRELFTIDLPETLMIQNLINVEVSQIYE